MKFQIHTHDILEMEHSSFGEGKAMTGSRFDKSTYLESAKTSPVQLKTSNCPWFFFVLKQWDGGVGAEVIIPQTSWQVVLSLRANAGSAPIAT